MIETRGLSKIYGEGGPNPVHALTDVSIQLNSGEYCAVMGPSGSGKSTFMNLIGCLDQPSSGEYLLAGENVSKMTPNQLAGIRSRSLGFVFQSFNLLPRISALDNVMLPMLYADCPRKERRSKAEKALCSVGLEDRMTHRPTELSGGQQQRVAIARALVNQPQVLLADEPTGALDSHTGLEILRLFEDLNRSGLTIMMVTHDDDVARHAQRILHFKDGVLVSQEVVDSPRAVQSEQSS